jgi:hypothetical protein
MRRSASALLLLLLPVLGSTVACKKRDPKEVEAEKARDQSDYADYVAKLGRAHTTLSALDLESIDDKPCDAAAMMAKAPPARSDNGRRTLPRVSAEFLARFASKDDPSAWTANKSEWAFLTDGNFSSHFRDHQSKVKYGLSSTAKMIRETWAPGRYVVVLWPTASASNQVPVFDKARKTFSGGALEGFAFVYDLTDNKVECQSYLSVQSSGTVKYRTGGRGMGRLLNKDPDKALRHDFEDNLEGQINALLPPKMSVNPMGSLFK